MLSYSFAKRAGAVIVVDASTCICLHSGPLAPDDILEIQRAAGPHFTFRKTGQPEFERALSETYKSSTAQAADAAAAAGGDLAALADSAASVDDLLDQRDDAPVVRLINAILLEAVRAEASDIHIEPLEHRLAVRFRIDGALRDILEPGRSLAPLLVSRIKVMARLDISDKRTPHDGRVSVRIGGHELDVRVSTLPSQHGERVVMRILDRSAIRLDPALLGMEVHDLAGFERLLSRPDGMVLVTGPTGSGKTTTLYTALAQLNQRDRNIMTVEDPIEYALEGIGQTQVSSRTGLSFANGLRAILRQDPDIIMVGEIRDNETARTAIQSAMTGHFVLSTLHTNTALGGVSRLIDMGAERYLLAPVLRGLIAQRLVRTLCEHCRDPGRATPGESEMLGGAIEAGEQLWRVKGCEKCQGQGYRGRTGLYEVVEINAPLQDMIHRGAPEAELVHEARRSSPSLLYDGAAKIRAGRTTAEEVARVARAET
ncbi:MAG: GspE/PulE family protein [Pararhodobacter sp.]